MATKKKVAKKPTKKVAKQKVPRTRGSGRWTEAGYWGWLRSQLRKISQKWPPIYEVKKLATRAATPEEVKMFGGKIKKVVQCNKCKNWFPDKKTSVDHVIPCGSCRSVNDIGPFVERLTVEVDRLQVLCNDCHKEKTQRERGGN